MKNSKSKLAACVTSLLIGAFAHNANAATYYVDATAGSDTYNGLAATSTTGVDGPWQTLEKVKNAALLPGDQVLLKCGQIWHEPLVISRSGTAANPIRVGSFPAGCSPQPVIDGSINIPSHSWSLYKGRIYRAPVPVRVMQNGDFNAGTSGWRAWSPQSDASVANGVSCPAGGSGCLSFVAGSGSAPSLLSSPRFPLETREYTLSWRLKAPSGAKVRVIVRRDRSPWDTLGLVRVINGTGDWEYHTLTFLGTASIGDARLDLEVPAGTAVGLDDVTLTASIGEPRQFFVDGKVVNPAHHPNRGFDASRPDSGYLLTAARGDTKTVGSTTGSSYLVHSGDLRLPAGGSVTPGLTVVVRTNAYIIDERTVASVSGNQVYFDSLTSFPLKSGWGFLLRGALWMLDQPGEWFYDASGGYVYVWTQDGSHPGWSAALGYGNAGVDLSGKSHIAVTGITVRRFLTGIRMPSSTSVALDSVTVIDVLDDGINAIASVNASIENSRILNTGRHAIAGVDPVTFAPAREMRVVGNTINNSGVRREGGKVVSVPNRSEAAIRPGANAFVSRNRITETGFFAIWLGQENRIEDNYVASVCLVLDDCGGIYMHYAHRNSIVARNLIIDVKGGVDGKAIENLTSQSQGIYLDQHSSGITVLNNTVVGAENGMQVHNAYDNRIEGNKLYGNRKYQLWLQEDTKSKRPDGDMYNNLVLNNVLVPTAAAPSVNQQTLFASTSDFSSFNGNTYSALYSPQIAVESSASGVKTYTISEWKTATTEFGMPRVADELGTAISLTGVAPYRVTGANLIPNADLASGLSRWTSWNEFAPFGVVSIESCSVADRCLRYQAGASKGVASTPNFTAVKDQWYRLSFDLRTGTSGQLVEAVVRRGGGGSNGYEMLMGSPQAIAGTTEWKRYSFTVKAIKTVNADDPVTLDHGARVDFHANTPGQWFSIGNVEIVPLSPAGSSSFKTNILMNESMSPKLINCPDAETNPTYCTSYLRFPDRTPVSWPVSLEPLATQIVFSQGDTLVDTDNDGIADIQDSCPETAAGASVSSRGCAIGQS